MKQVHYALFTLFTWVVICHAQTINLSGIVNNSEGVGIEGVRVRLGKADQSTITGSDGSFALTGIISGVKHSAAHTAIGTRCPFSLKDGMLFFNEAEPAEVKVTVYDLKGRCLFSRGKIASAGNRSMTLPHFASGIHLHHVSINNTGYMFRSVAGITANSGPVSPGKEIAPIKQAKTSEHLDDALLFTKEGYRLYRVPVTNPDTSGMLITMTLLETGTVTDTDGNVYRTARFGNQEWTVENLRTTKYHDGESIPLVDDSAAWGTAATPAYCFFDYTTDTAEQRIWGAFYNWYAVNTGKLAPTGWHVPTNDDWDTLQNYLVASGYNFDGTTSENRIAKSIASKTDWLESADSGACGNDPGKNNASGFSGLPNGYCDYAGITYYRNWYAFWWTATRKDSSLVNIRGIAYHGRDLKKSAFTEVYGLSVRLVRDQ